MLSDLPMNIFLHLPTQTRIPRRLPCLFQLAFYPHHKELPCQLDSCDKQRRWDSPDLWWDILGSTPTQLDQSKFDSKTIKSFLFVHSNFSCLRQWFSWLSFSSRFPLRSRRCNLSSNLDRGNSWLIAAMSKIYRPSCRLSPPASLPSIRGCLQVATSHAPQSKLKKYCLGQHRFDFCDSTRFTFVHASQIKFLDHLEWFDFVIFDRGRDDGPELFLKLITDNAEGIDGDFVVGNHSFLNVFAACEIVEIVARLDRIVHLLQHLRCCVDTAWGEANFLAVVLRFGLLGVGSNDLNSRYVAIQSLSCAFHGFCVGQNKVWARSLLGQVAVLPSLVFSFNITETSEIISTTKAKLQTMLMSVSARSNPVLRFHQFGFLKIAKRVPI